VNINNNGREELRADASGDTLTLGVGLGEAMLRVGTGGMQGGRSK
jgi:hypothetical protein